MIYIYMYIYIYLYLYIYIYIYIYNMSLLPAWRTFIHPSFVHIFKGIAERVRWLFNTGGCIIPFPFSRRGVHSCIHPLFTTRDKQSVSGAHTLRAGTQSLQALSGSARSITVGEGRNSRRRYSRYGYIGPCCDGSQIPLFIHRFTAGRQIWRSVV